MRKSFELGRFFMPKTTFKKIQVLDYQLSIFLPAVGLN